ncbi:MAG: DUF2784 domain-containing protein [Smithella sp.]
MYLLLADAVIVFHFLFLVFVVAGGLLVLRRRRMAFLHLPAALWGAFIEFSGGICPLTPLENHLRLLGGESPYSGDFIVQYLIPVIYPAHLTVSIQYILGSVVIAINLMIYALVIRKRYVLRHRGEERH